MILYAEPMAPPFHPQAILRANLHQVIMRLRTKRHGLGGCPAIAPYETTGGSCSNIPPGVSTDPDAFVQTPFTSGILPGGYFMNTVTGVVEKLTIPQGSSQQEITYAAGAAEATRAAAEAEGAAAMAGGRARGLNVACETRENKSPNSPSMFFSECVVNGTPGHDAGLLIRPGGYEIASAEVARVGGKPLTSAAVLVNPSAVTYRGPSGETMSPWMAHVQEVLSTFAPEKQAALIPKKDLKATTPPADKKPWTNNSGGASDDAGAGAFSEQLEQLQMSVSGLPVWALALGAGVLVMVFMGGRR